MSTLAELRKRFYARFDEQGQLYIDPDQANSLINEGAAQLHNWLVVEGENYVWQEATLPLVAGQLDYTLPDNFLKMLKVFSVGGTNASQMRPLPRLMPQEYQGARLGWSQCGGVYAARAYMLLGQNLRIVPAPSTNPGSIVYWWVPQYAPLSADTDTTPLSMFVGSEEFIVNQAVIGARIKEESDTTPLERRQQEVLSMMQQTLINRDMGQHARVVDAEPMWR